MGLSRRAAPSISAMERHETAGTTTQICRHNDIGAIAK
jgi:hypothetical protein